MTDSPLVLFANFMPLRTMPPHLQQALAGHARLLQLAPGQSLFDTPACRGQVLWLVEGSVGFAARNSAPEAFLHAASSEATQPLRPGAYGASALCLTPVTCLALPAQLLDRLLATRRTLAMEVTEVSARTAQQLQGDWTAALLRLPAFRRVPPAKLQAIFLRLQPAPLRAGEVVIHQGDEADFFYVLVEGCARVLRESSNRRKVLLSDLGPGACFGEDALISGGRRDATVIMLTDGRLMRLAREDFRELLQASLLRKLTAAQAEALIARGEAQWLDVRLPSEVQSGRLANSLSIPWPLLRLRLAQLDPGKTWICVCDGGQRSEIAAFVLAQKGFKVFALAGAPPV